MSERTGIAWTDATWNPWVGCAQVSPGCDHCYMFAGQRRWGQDPATVRRAATTFNDPLKWAEGRKVFTCSWSDFFHADADAWRPEAWEIIRRTPQHTYQILTKRHGRIARHLPPDWGDGYPNVWLGVSAENQEWADRRISSLFTVPAAVRWISAEPLLGPLDLSGYLPALDWVVVGGESGPDHRPMELRWLAEIVQRCKATRTAVFVKQDSGPKPGRRGRIPISRLVQQFPAALRAAREGGQ